MSNEEIVEQIQNGIEITTNQERLWQKNKGFVVKCIKKYVGNCDRQDLSDFLQEGFIGLVEAAHSFDIGQGVKFLTYAEYGIRKAVYRYNGLNTYMVRIPEYLKTRMRKLSAFKQEYREKFHREPDTEEIQRALHISSRSLCHLEKVLLNMRTRSLDEYISDDGDSSLLDMLSTDEKIEKLAGSSEYQRELHEELEAALSILDDKTALMIRCAYYQRNSYTKTAKIFGCSRQAVDERINKGFYRILHSKHKEKLESFMWEGYHVDPRRLNDYVDMEEIDNMGSEFLL
ncbi:sigma-70 family RNA polymerase sigma factor [Candidatus Merdisoma sp. JLR.KK006]|uniref:sigma-70 family RNA polymerase sigma factor n=1 Tax=Candidatus Merdisoma sp. JLR.KK006 TaxID=3112626 RepID=UPI002FF05BCA